MSPSNQQTTNTEMFVKHDKDGRACALKATSFTLVSVGWVAGQSDSCLVGQPERRYPIRKWRAQNRMGIESSGFDKDGRILIFSD